MNLESNRFEIKDIKKDNPYFDRDEGDLFWQIFKKKIHEDYKINVINFADSLESDVVQAGKFKRIVDDLETKKRIFTTYECFFLEEVLKKEIEKIGKFRPHLRSIGTQVDPEMMYLEESLNPLNPLDPETLEKLNYIREKSLTIDDLSPRHSQSSRPLSYIYLPLRILQRGGNTALFSEERLINSLKSKLPQLPNESIERIASEVIQNLYKQQLFPTGVKVSPTYLQIEKLVNEMVGKNQIRGKLR